MAPEFDPDIDIDEPPTAPEPAKDEDKAKSEDKPAETVRPKHKPFFLNRARKYGISEAEANEMDANELEAAIRIASAELAESKTTAAAKETDKRAEEEDEDFGEEFSKFAKDYDEEFVAPIKSALKRVVAKTSERAKLAEEKLAKIEEAEKKRAEAEFARRIDEKMIRSGIAGLGNKPISEYSKNAPEAVLRRMVLSTANELYREGDSIEDALERALGHVRNLNSSDTPEPPVAKAKARQPEPEPEPDELSARRRIFEKAGLQRPTARADAEASSASEKITNILRAANARG